MEDLSLQMKNNMEQEQKEYRWTTSWKDPITKIDVNKVIAEIDEIKAEHGKINATLLLEKAKNKKSIIHNYFTWDDKVAAEHYRRSEAARLLRGVEIKIIKDDKPLFVRAFEIVNISSDNFSGVGGKYIDAGEMTSIDIEKMRGLLINEITGLIKRMSPYSEFDKAKSYVEWALKVMEKNKETKEVNGELKVAVAS